MKDSSQYEPKHGGKKKKGRTLTVAITAVVLLFLVSAATVLFLSEKNAPEKKPVVSLSPISVSTPSPTPTPRIELTPKSSPTPEPPPEMLPYMRELYEQNPDIVGYIHIDDTNIDGPVLYTEGEDYYLYRGFDRQDHIEGCLFVDKHNKVEPRDANLIIHGHNMENGHMFHDLLKYDSEEYYEEHKIIRFDSLYEMAEYEIVAAFISQVYYETDEVFKFYKEYDFKNESEFEYFMDNIQELSLYDTGVDAKFGDEFITLSTCEYTREDGRMVVVARKKESTHG